MVRLERRKVNLNGDARRLKNYYLKMMREGDADQNIERQTIQELSFVQSGLISQLTEMGVLLHQVIEGLIKQGNSQIAVKNFSEYYQFIKNLLNDIHSGTRRARRRTNELNRDKSRGFGGKELSDRKEARMEFKESKQFESLFNVIKENLKIILEYVSNSKNITNIIANESFKVINERMNEFLTHSENLSELLIDMGFDIKKKVQEKPNDSKNLRFLNKAESRSSRRAA